jgi:hypothetical protein
MIIATAAQPVRAPLEWAPEIAGSSPAEVPEEFKIDNKIRHVSIGYN